MEKKNFAVSGMKCVHCKARVEEAIRALDGVVIASCVKVPAEDDGYSPGQDAKRKPVIPRRNFDARLKIYPRIFRRTRVN